MCGIVGFNWDDQHLIRRMADKIRHRGPDGAGYYTDKHVSLGSRRLAIIDLSAKGKQPITNEDSTIWIVFNGEIYNFHELREELEKSGHRFSSNTDTEVIVHAYEEYGIECLHRFNGMFSFCIYDTTKKRLFLARDPIGIKPLYYTWEEGKLIFSSEIKAIFLAPINPKQPNLGALGKLLSYRFIPTDETLFLRIKKLPAGHYAILENNKLNIVKYWDILSDQPRTKNNLQTLKNLLNDSVRDHLIADVPVGSFLSGGVDSSIISALAQQHMRKEGSTLKTFTAFFDDFSEKNDATLVAEHIGAEYHDIYIDEKKALSVLEAVFYYADEPVLDPAVIPTFILSNYARKKVKVVLAGEGGDELFGGYAYYQRMAFIHNQLNLLKKLMIPLKPLTQLPLPHKIERAFEIQGEINNIGHFYASISAPFKKDDLTMLLATKPEEPFISWNTTNMKSILNKLSYFDLKTLLPEYYLMKADKMTMANSLEERVPYLTKGIAEFAFHLPTGMKFKSGGKYILRKIAKKLLPREIVKKPKQGYGVPNIQWIMHGDMGELIESELESYLKNQGVFKKEYIKKLFEQYKTSRSAAVQLWMVYGVNRWYATNFQNS